VRRVVVTSIAAVIGAILLTAGIFYLTGGRWYVIKTPSMGQYAPVGTLVFSTVSGLASLRTGTVLLFHPPTAPNEVFFHRIVSISHGAIRTRGDINAAIDPWTLHAHDLIGTEFARFVGLGWLVEALPILLVGGVVLHVVTRYYVIRYWRFPLRVLGWSLLVALAAYLIKPFVRAVLLTQVVHHGTATSTLVPTGLFDVSARAVLGTTAVLRPGEPGSVTSSHVASTGYFEIDLSPSLGFWAWVLLIVIWLVPAVLCFVYALRRPQPEPV
jgi:hypothetical protein